jgi:hypothetical protein
VKSFFPKALQKNWQFFVRPVHSINTRADGGVCSSVCWLFVCTTVGGILTKFDTSLCPRQLAPSRCEKMIFPYCKPYKAKKVVVLAYFKLLYVHSPWKTKLKDLIVSKNSYMFQCLNAYSSGSSSVISKLHTS